MASLSPNVPICSMAVWAESRRLIAESIALRVACDAAIVQSRVTVSGCQATRAPLNRHDERQVAVSIRSLLLVFPPDGSWMAGAGWYLRVLSDFLDADTTLVEEQLSDNDDTCQAVWIVRLSARGLVERRLCELDGVMLPS